MPASSKCSKFGYYLKCSYCITCNVIFNYCLHNTRYLVYVAIQYIKYDISNGSLVIRLYGKGFGLLPTRCALDVVILFPVVRDQAGSDNFSAIF